MNKQIKNTIGAVILFQFLAISFVLGGCKLLPGQDPVVVNAERTTAIALDTFDAFLKFEYEKKEELAKISPDIHKVAENIRKNGKNWLMTARELTKAYKQNRSAENKFNLMTALAVLQSAMSESQKYIAAIKPN